MNQITDKFFDDRRHWRIGVVIDTKLRNVSESHWKFKMEIQDTSSEDKRFTIKAQEKRITEASLPKAPNSKCCPREKASLPKDL